MDQDARLSEIEVKLTFAENLIDELNPLRSLRQQVQESLPAEPRSLRDEIPPHY